MTSGVPHHCHHLNLVRRHASFVQFTKTELSLVPLYLCAWFGLVIALLMAFLKNALKYIKKKNQINYILIVYSMLLHIMLYVMLAYLILFAALFNAVCIMLIFLPLIFANAFCFHAVLGY